jgi:hypothetical protein
MQAFTIGQFYCIEQHGLGNIISSVSYLSAEAFKIVKDGLVSSDVGSSELNSSTKKMLPIDARSAVFAMQLTSERVCAHSQMQTTKRTQ